MLPKKHRLSRKDLLALKLQGKRKTFPEIAIIFKKNNVGRLRFGVEISAKVARKAVRRNSIRRKIMDSLPDAKRREPLDLLIILRPFSGERPNTERIIKNIEAVL